MTAFTGIKQPLANRFRINDHWLGPNGANYLVKRGVADFYVALQPLQRGNVIHIRRNSIAGFKRLKWGGQP